MINRKLLFLFFIGWVAMSHLHAQGLQFYGNKTPIEQHTSCLIFTPECIPTFANSLDVDFELRIEESGTFGYLLHLVEPETQTAYSLTYTYIDSKTSAFNFNTEGKVSHLTMKFDNDSIKMKWLPLKLHIDLPTGEIRLMVAGKTVHSKSNVTSMQQFRPSLYFGLRQHLVDVPSFSIRKLEVYDSRQRFVFAFNESQGQEVHDIKGTVLGKVTNPYWLINDSYHWKKLVALNSLQCIGYAYDNIRQEIHFINKDSLFSYQLGKRILVKRPYANKMPVKTLLGTNFIDEAANKIYAYEINNLPVGDTTFAALNVPTLTWEAMGDAHTPVQLHHHNGYWDAQRQRYLVFGGFGNRLYSNRFLFYNASADRWDTLAFKKNPIPPRFYASIAASHQKEYLYIYGGVGNESGDQSVGHNYYNDLYRVNLADHSIEKCWDIHLDEKLVPSGKMVLSEDEKSLYVLRYPEYVKSSFLQLYKISIENGSMELLGDSIPFVSGSIRSNVTLYYNPELKEFYCVTQEYDEETRQATEYVYVLSSPPVGKNEMEFYATPQKSTNVLWWLLPVSFIVVVALVIYSRNRRKKNMAVATPSPIHTRVASSATVIPLSQKTQKEVRNNSIYVYGIFTVYGKTGRDITYLFSNKLKHIFLYILLKSNKDGVSSTSLNDIFWPDKTEEKAKNLKGVTVSNLRKVLSEVDGVELIYEKGFFKIMITEPCYCDYFSMHEHLASYPKSYEFLLSIWERGNLLEDVKHELFDKRKQYSEDIVISMLPQELESLYMRNELKSVLSICAVIQRIDPLCESALLYSIYAYNKLNDFESVSRVYATFVLEYRKTMGEAYPNSLDTLLQKGK